MIRCDRYGFADLRVPKTSCTSREQAFVRREPYLAYSVFPRHARHEHVEAKEHLRIQCIRHPLARMESLYFYWLHIEENRLNNREWRAEIWAEFIHDPDRFFRWFFEENDEDVYWRWSQAEYLEAWRPHVLVPCETATESYDALFRHRRWPEPRLGRRNRSEHHFEFDSSLRRYLTEKLRDDFEVLGYDPDSREHPAEALWISLDTL